MGIRPLPAPAALALGAVLTAAGACGEGGSTPTIAVGEVPEVMRIVSGNNQFTTPGSPLELPLTVLISDSAGRVVPGVPVEWVGSHGVGFEFRNGRTDVAGKAVALVVLGRDLGSYEITVQVTGNPEIAVRFLQFVTVDGRPPRGPPPVATITVGDNYFRPRTVSAKILDGVRWIWEGTDRHDIVFLDSDAVSPGFGNTAAKVEGSFTGVINREGVIEYYCSLHGRDEQWGTISVTN